jgi:porin
MRAGIFAGNAGDQGRNNQHGMRFRLGSDEGALIMAEADYKTNTGENAAGLPGTFKLGGFYHTAKFEDFETGKSHRGDYGFYAVADQAVYREPCRCCAKDPTDGGDKNEQGLNVFARVGGAPEDRNIVSNYVEGGLNYKGLLPGRDDDVCGVACSFTRISDEFQSDDAGHAQAHHETVLEFTYQAVLTPWLSVQPDVQYIFNPGAVQKQDDALVAGVRLNLTF